MAQTIAEKIFSAHSGKTIMAGDITIANIDVVMATDGSGPLTIDIFNKMNGNRVFDKNKILMVLDHYVPCPNDKVAALHDSMRSFAKKDLCTIFELGEGICHQLLPEHGYVLPGGLIVGGDSHSTTYGALNCLGTGVGSSDLAAAMLDGKLWFRVPETYKVYLTGNLRGAAAKDLALHLVHMIGIEGAIYKSIEFCGDGVQSLSISERMTICNMMVETGAKCALMPFDEETKRFFNGKYFLGYNADEGATYEIELEVNLCNIVPMVAKPHQVDNVSPLSELGSIDIHMGILGTCTNGRIEDLRIVAEVLRKHTVKKGVELLVVPASKAVYIQAAQEGILADLVSKGATILPPGCGPCCGSSPGIPSNGENIISTANRNFIGRMGNVNANIYLGSPHTLAMAVITGKLTSGGMK